MAKPKQTTKFNPTPPAEDHWYETDGYFDQQQGPWKAQALTTEASAWRSPEDVPVDPHAFAHAAAAYKSMNATCHANAECSLFLVLQYNKTVYSI